MTRTRVLATLACVAVVSGLGSFVDSAAAASPPPNDLISGATVVTGLPFTRTVDTTGATTDANDAQVNATCGAPFTNKSVWYKFTAGPSDTSLVVDTTGSNFSSGVIIATGAPGALTTVACGPVSARTGVTSGKTFYILAFDDTGAGGTLQISMHGGAPAPANDTIAHAAAVPALPFSDTLDTSGATTDAVDTQANASCGAPATGNSVWYKFTAGPNKNIFVDASASDYFAGVLVATGTPGSLTTVSCGAPFVTAATTPGTTYYIMVFDAFGGGGGTLRLNIGAAPTIVVKVHKNALIDTHGVVHVTGTYRCTDARFVDTSGLLIEIVGRKVATGSFDNLGVPAARCDGNRHGWTGLALPANIGFAPGNVAAFINAIACGPIACTQISKTGVVTLANSVAGTTGFAGDASFHTRTIRRPLARSYGNARHPTTITWRR